LRKGVVKNIADFGVFVDLGGLDGLLHISDLSWGRISHPSEVVGLDQEIECIVIGVDKENEKISLGLKQKRPSPWEDIEERYPIGARVKGKIVNVMNYGVFVRLEDGVEGLVHISEMSWTKRLTHPSEIVNLGDEIEVIVLNVNKEKQEISLGLKQTEVNPWTVAAQKYPSGTIVTAKVRSMTNFGAFLEIEPGIDGMIHISDLSWTKKYGHPSEAIQKGKEVKCVVLEVNEGKQRISLGTKQMNEDPWIRAIPEKYIPGHIIKGKIAKLTNFGAFVELEPDLEGLLHISELADHKIEKPQDIVKVGDEVEVKILKVDAENRKIGLSLRRVQWTSEEQTAKSIHQKDSEVVHSSSGESEEDPPAQTQSWGLLTEEEIDQATAPSTETSEDEQSKPGQPSAHKDKTAEAQGNEVVLGTPNGEQIDSEQQSDSTGSPQAEHSEDEQPQENPNSDVESVAGSDNIAEQKNEEA